VVVFVWKKKISRQGGENKAQRRREREKQKEVQNVFSSRVSGGFKTLSRERGFSRRKLVILSPLPAS
jgi:hypothetical protein